MSKTNDIIENTVHTDGSGLNNEIGDLVQVPIPISRCLTSLLALTGTNIELTDTIFYYSSYASTIGYKLTKEVFTGTQTFNPTSWGTDGTKYLKKVEGIATPVVVDVKPSFGKCLETKSLTNLGENRVKGDWYSSEIPTALNIVNSNNPFGDNSLIYKLELDGNITPTIGALGTQNGGSFVTGFHNQAYKSDLSSYGIMTGAFTALTSFSVSFKAEAKLINNFALGNQTSGWNAFSCHTWNGNNLFFGTDLPTRGLTTNSPLKTEGYNHIVITLDGNTCTLYVNNQVEMIKTVTASTGLTQLIVGSYDVNVLTYDATYDQIEVYNKALTQSEVTTLYNQGEYSYITTPLPPQSYIEDSTGKLAEFVVASGVVTTINQAEYVPSIVENSGTFNEVRANAFIENTVHTDGSGLSDTNLTNKTGEVIAYATSTAPNGYLECNGSALSRTTYVNLFGVIGTLYGTGDGSTTFNIPDLRGEFIRGFDNARGVDSGRSIGSWQEDEFESHSHRVKHLNWGYGAANYSNYRMHSSGSYSTSYIENSGGTETRPRNIALMYCIKY